MTKGDPLTRTQLVNNGICYLFEEIRYEFNAIEIDRCKNVRLTSIMKGWSSFNPSRKTILENGGWLCEEGNIINDPAYFDVLIPLNMVLSCAEYYRKIIVNMKHELILLRSRSDLNAVIQTVEADALNNAPEEFKIDIFQIE